MVYPTNKKGTDLYRMSLKVAVGDFRYLKNKLAGERKDGFQGPFFLCSLAISFKLLCLTLSCPYPRFFLVLAYFLT